MAKRKCALLDTDYISKLHITRKNEDSRLIDKILELPDYHFVCHEQIEIELTRHNTSAIQWLRGKIEDGAIQKYTDLQLISILHSVYGKNAISFYLFYLSNSCNLFSRDLYREYYAELEQKRKSTNDSFAAEIACCDALVGCDKNLGEIKTYLMQQVLQQQNDLQLFVFYSDDKKARAGLVNAGGIPCISAIASFYVLKERLGLERDEAMLYFDSWMKMHHAIGQTRFRVHKNTKEMQLMWMEGREIFNRIYDGTITLLKNGNLKLK